MLDANTIVKKKFNITEIVLIIQRINKTLL